MRNGAFEKDFDSLSSHGPDINDLKLSFEVEHYKSRIIHEIFNNFKLDCKLVSLLAKHSNKSLYYAYKRHNNGLVKCSIKKKKKIFQRGLIYSP